MVFSTHVLWELLTAGVWGGFTGSKNQLPPALNVIKAEIKGFYKSRKVTNEDEVATQISDLNIRMVGINTDRKLKLKAMEVHYFMLFLLEKLRDRQDSLPNGRALFDAGCGLELFWETFTESGPIISKQAQHDRLSILYMNLHIYHWWVEGK